MPILHLSISFYSCTSPSTWNVNIITQQHWSASSSHHTMCHQTSSVVSSRQPFFELAFWESFECQIIHCSCTGSSVKHEGFALNHGPDTFTQFSNTREDWRCKFTLHDRVHDQRQITLKLHANEAHSEMHGKCSHIIHKVHWCFIPREVLYTVPRENPCKSFYSFTYMKPFMCSDCQHSRRACGKKMA